MAKTIVIKIRYETLKSRQLKEDLCHRKINIIIARQSP